MPGRHQHFQPSGFFKGRFWRGGPTHPHIVDVQVVVLLGSQDPLDHVWRSDVWELVGPVFAVAHPAREGPGQSCSHNNTKHSHSTCGTQKCSRSRAKWCQFKCPNYAIAFQNQQCWWSKYNCEQYYDKTIVRQDKVKSETLIFVKLQSMCPLCVAAFEWSATAKASMSLWVNRGRRSVFWPMSVMLGFLFLASFISHHS